MFLNWTSDCNSFVDNFYFDKLLDSWIMSFASKKNLSYLFKTYVHSYNCSTTHDTLATKIHLPWKITSFCVDTTYSNVELICYRCITWCWSSSSSISISSWTLIASRTTTTSIGSKFAERLNSSVAFDRHWLNTALFCIRSQTTVWWRIAITVLPSYISTGCITKWFRISWISGRTMIVAGIFRTILDVVWIV